MRSALGGILTGALLLIVGQVLLTASGTSSSGADTILSLFQVPGQLAANWMSPAVPLIPDLSRQQSKRAPATPATPSRPAPPPGSQTGGGLGVPTFPLPLPVVP